MIIKFESLVMIVWINKLKLITRICCSRRVSQYLIPKIGKSILLGSAQHRDRRKMERICAAQADV